MIRGVEDAAPYMSIRHSSLRTQHSALKKIDAPKCVDFLYYWEFLTVMNRASTSLVVSGLRKE
jgi:hypothetical protein